MTTLYWQIAPELDQLRRQTEQMLEARGQAPTEPRTWKPAAELRDLGDRYELQLQLPGVDAESLDIQATRDSVTVTGERPSSSAKLIHSEFRTGTFKRAVRLPEAVQHQVISADYSHGLLSLRLPKLTAAPDYRVKVSVNSGDAATAVEADSQAETPDLAHQANAEVAATDVVNTKTVTAEPMEDVWADQAA